MTSFAWGGTKPLGTISVNNGLNTVTEPDVPDPDWFDFVLKQFGSVLKKIALDTNGYAELRIPKLARASATGVTAHSYGDARSTEQEIANRALEIVGDPDPTFTIGFHDAPVPNKQVDPTILKMDIGLIYYGVGFGQLPPPPESNLSAGLAVAVLHALPWGFWNQPQGAWDWTDDPRANWTTSQLYREFTDAQVIQMILSGPVTLNNHFQIHDLDGISEEGHVEVEIHAPWEFPVWTSDEEVSDDFARVSGWILRNPYGPISITEAFSYGKAVTWSVRIGFDAQGLDRAHPLIRAFNIGGEYGETATVTQTQNYTMTVGAGPSDLEFCIQKQNLWRERRGFFLAYTASGFSGLQNMKMTEWVSGNKAMAERIDHRYRLHSREAR